MLRKTLAVCVLTILTAAALPQEVEAQPRAVRRSTPRRVVHVVSRPYSPVYYSRFYSRWHPGWYGAGWYGAGWYGAGWYGGPGWYPYGFYGQYYPPYHYRYSNAGSARLEVKPRDAEVYIDGYLVGTVDDFDGWLQRLHVEPGEHDLEIYAPGYRTYREKVLFRPGATLRITHELEPLPAGESLDPRPAPSAQPQPSRRPRAYPPGRSPDEYPSQAPRGADRESGSGAVAIRVQPSDAEVLIDGERWDSPQGSERLVVQLGDGEHRVEVRREGYRPFTTTVRIRPGETSALNVSLTRQE